jgi:hypothetical protein
MRWTSLLVAAVVVVLAQKAHAQIIFRPFFDSGVTAYDPVVSVVTSGVMHDVQATVTADQKYVTITERGTSSTVVGFQTFGFNTGDIQNGNNAVQNNAPQNVPVAPTLGQGFVGAAQPNNLNNPLNRQGITRVGED